MEDFSEEKEQLNIEDDSSEKEPKESESKEEVKGKKKSVKKNYFYNLIYQLFLVIVPLVVTPYVSRVLTTSGVGQYSFSYSLITYFTLFGSLGFGHYAQREIAKNQGNKYAQSKSFWEINICRLIPVGIAFLLNLVLCLLNVYGSYNNLMFIFLINIGALAFDIVFFFQGNEEFSKIVFRNVVIKSLSIIAIFVFVKTEDDLWIYALINSGMLIASNLSLWPYMVKYLVRINIKELNPLKHLKGTLILFLPTIAVSIYTVLDKTLIGLLVKGSYTEIVDGTEVVKKYSDLENGYYEQSEKLIKMVMVVITCIGTVMIPRNSNEFAKGNYEKVKNNINISARLVMLLGLPMTFGIIAVASNLVPWFFGPGYDKSIILLKILSPLIVIIGFSNIFGLQYLVPSKQDLKFSLCLCIGAIANIILNLILIPFWWSIGASIATIIAELLVTIIMAFFVRKEVDFLKLLKNTWKIVVSSVCMFVILCVLSNRFEASILNTLFLVFIGIVIYLFLLLVLREEYLYKVIFYLMKKIKKKM